MAQVDLDLASLNVLLQRVRRRPEDRPTRLRAAEDVAILADLDAKSVRGDKLLAEAIFIARLLRRALDRANKSAHPSTTDVAAINAWIDKFQSLSSGRSPAQADALGRGLDLVRKPAGRSASASQSGAGRRSPAATSRTRADRGGTAESNFRGWSGRRGQARRVAGGAPSSGRWTMLWRWWKIG
jgi:hypothetical protein